MQFRPYTIVMWLWPGLGGSSDCLNWHQSEPLWLPKENNASAITQMKAATHTGVLQRC